MIELFYGLAFLAGVFCGSMLTLGLVAWRHLRIVEPVYEREEKLIETVAELRTELMKIDSVIGEVVHGVAQPMTCRQQSAAGVRYALQYYREKLQAEGFG